MAKEDATPEKEILEGSAPPILPPHPRSAPPATESPNTEDIEADDTAQDDEELDDDEAEQSPPELPSSSEIAKKVREYNASFATIDRQLHKGNPHKLTACFNERSHFLSPEEDLSARYEPTPQGPLSLGLNTPSYRLVLRDQAKGLMMIVDPQNTKTPLHVVPYAPPIPLSAEAQKTMPAEMAAFNAATQNVQRLDQAYETSPEIRTTFMNTIQAAVEAKRTGETDAKNIDMVRGSIGFLDNASTIKSGLKSVLNTPAGGLMSDGLKGVSGIFSLIDALRHLADGRVAQSVVSLTGSVPLVGAFIQEGVAVGAEKLGFDVDPGPIQQAIESAQGLIPPETPEVCGTPQINMKGLQASLDERAEKKPQDSLAAGNSLSRNKPQTPHL